MVLPSPREYDTTLDYYINVSTPCPPGGGAGGGVRLEVGVFASLCQYFSESEKQWRTDGMLPLVDTSPHRAVCRTRHLTAFAAGLFVPANAISFIQPVPRGGCVCVYRSQGPPSMGARGPPIGVVGGP